MQIPHLRLQTPTSPQSWNPFFQNSIAICSTNPLKARSVEMRALNSWNCWKTCRHQILTNEDFENGQLGLGAAVTNNSKNIVFLHYLKWSGRFLKNVALSKPASQILFYHNLATVPDIKLSIIAKGTKNLPMFQWGFFLVKTRYFKKVELNRSKSMTVCAGLWEVDSWAARNPTSTSASTSFNLPDLRNQQPTITNGYDNQPTNIPTKTNYPNATNSRSTNQPASQTASY